MLKSSNISEKIKVLRNKSLKKRKSHDLNKPVAFWIKEDRLLNEIGKELTIILRTKGCKWALSEDGGCSMCGYVQDASNQEVQPEHLVSQFDYALQNKIEEIRNDNNNYIIKLFNSGSFFDDDEVMPEVRSHIYQEINKIEKIKEVVVESRTEYIMKEKLVEINTHLKDKYIEIGIGLETTDDYIRNHYINKGAQFNEFQDALKLCKEYKIGVKAYLLFKPPFLTEQAAIDDCSKSIQTLIQLGVNSISVNPVNIQKGSLTENLWYQKRYRPPWYYSLFKCLRRSISQEDLKTTRILCDPSGSGGKRGIHNCLNKECNANMASMLKLFVLNQNRDELRNNENECDCKLDYLLQKNYS